MSLLQLPSFILQKIIYDPSLEISTRCNLTAVCKVIRDILLSPNACPTWRDAIRKDDRGRCNRQMYPNTKDFYTLFSIAKRHVAMNNNRCFHCGKNGKLFQLKEHVVHCVIICEYCQRLPLFATVTYSQLRQDYLLKPEQITLLMKSLPQKNPLNIVPNRRSFSKKDADAVAARIHVHPDLASKLAEKARKKQRRENNIIERRRHRHAAFNNFMTKHEDFRAKRLATLRAIDPRVDNFVGETVIPPLYLNGLLSTLFETPLWYQEKIYLELLWTRVHDIIAIFDSYKETLMCFGHHWYVPEPISQMYSQFQMSTWCKNRITEFCQGSDILPIVLAHFERIRTNGLILRTQPEQPLFPVAQYETQLFEAPN